MHSRPLVAAPLLALALLSTAAWADEDDLDVIGPNGRSSVGLKLGYSRYTADGVTVATGRKVFDSTVTGRHLDLQGVYAINERFSLALELPTQRVKSKVSGGALSNESTETSTDIGLLGAWRALGSITQQGFGLVVNAGVAHMEDGPNVFHLGVQPQYRFSPEMLVGGTVFVDHDNDGNDNVGAKLTGVWRFAPAWSLVPQLTFVHSQDDAPDWQRAELSVKYRVDAHWSVTGGASYTKLDRITSAGVPTALENQHVSRWDLGVRYSF